VQGVEHRLAGDPDQPGKRLIQLQDQKNSAGDSQSGNHQSEHDSRIGRRENAEAQENDDEPGDKDDQHRLRNGGKRLRRQQRPKLGEVRSEGYGLFFELALRVIATPAEAEARPGRLDLLPASRLPADLPFGRIDPRAGAAAYAYVERAIALAQAGEIDAIVTAPLNKEAMKAADARVTFTEFLRGLGIGRPRVKFLPLLRIGREERRSRGYLEREALGPEPLASEVLDSLICSSSRTVTARGVVTCPILVEDPAARLGDTLDEAERAIHLKWRACHTCVVDGLRCAT